MIRNLKLLAAAAILWPAAAASAQSSSLYRRAEQGAPPAQPTVTEPGPEGPGRAANRADAVDRPAASAAGSAATDASPRPGATQPPVQPYPLLSATNGPAGASPAVANLHRASFTAIAPPQPKLFNPHDLVTIIVREETSFASDGESDLEKKYSMEAKLEKWLELRLGNAQITPAPMNLGEPEIKGSADRKFEGDGSIKRKDTFIGRITAEVVDVKPNGTLVLAARKFIQTDNEKQWFELTGSCRADDVNADNTVLSTQLADLSVVKKHAGQVRDSSKRGIIPWLVDKLNPF